MSLAGSSNNGKLLCAECNCSKFAIPNSNYCKDHQKGGGNLFDGFFEAINRAVTSGEINRVDDVRSNERVGT